VNISDYKVVVYQDNPLWEKTLVLWCQNYGFEMIQSFNDKDTFLDYVNDEYDNIDICIMDFYEKEDNTISPIKHLRKLNENCLILAVSANFVNDENVLDTNEMVKALWAGANRATFKDIKHVKDIIFGHLAVRSHENYSEIKTDPNRLLKNYKY
jgi:DNA-binding NarL/FixJ family response regulator